ncbi:MAG: succinyl-diaminopimelate desuccinylase [Planktomarina sp.]|nr:succinyl-diaminopimelate desuccinylase [Planktomarina sp.]MDT2032488.1 succinyl-diaminopimelate desuccinylase [Planktomarina sp.]MDT2039030.1 succinyl-diaminopimelate desuccinylase [Planktomarina sp.]MDT2048786.1 succinyl-diaminopimelate desuccinylase [Planktomarina sp.]|tara:strand:- start:2387 stop:3517 length:1131 start_codon:yes stop_codon:yes gene_type:complete
MINAVDLTADLIRCSSVTPNEGGALKLLEAILSDHGFSCTRVDRGKVSNLFARWGSGKTFGFNGHTDVVPVGDISSWTFDPFGAKIHDGWMYGRGAADMKSGVAAFAAAAIDFVTDTPPSGSIVLAITGDEEGPAKDGTLALLDWMEAKNEFMDVCLVGEPTCPDEMGQMIKIGRRGSMNAHFKVTGKQGHSAYPHRAKNPLPAMARLVDQLSMTELDHGTQHFDASTIAVVTIDTGNSATNIIPKQSLATVNIRFNDSHSGDSLTKWLKIQTEEIMETFGVEISTEVHISGESFITPPGAFSDLVARAVQVETNRKPILSTSGGTSDARFVQHHCPVIEFGLVGKTMHQVDERVEVAQIHQLKSIYTRVLSDYFT